MRPNFFHHLHPPTIPAEQARWRYTLGAGGIAVFLVVVIMFTGVLEMFFYIPTPEKAARSIQTISFLIPFGGLVRNLHYWAAQGLLIVSSVHLIRVIFTAAYASPRKFNYLIGIGVFLLIILLDFTGYILRWDTGIHWALVVGTNLIKSIPIFGNSFYQFIVGADQPGEATLLRFYAWHVAGLMIPTLLLIGWHAFRVRRDGGITTPQSSRSSTKFVDGLKISRFELVQKETLAMLLTLAILITIAILIPAPIDAALNPLDASGSPSSTSAPWFFLWIQQMLQWGDPFTWGVLVPILILALITFIPYIFPITDISQVRQWFSRSNRLARFVFLVLVGAVLILTLMAYGD